MAAENIAGISEKSSRNHHDKSSSVAICISFYHLKCVGYIQIQLNHFSLEFQQTVTRLGHIYLQGVSITFVHCVFFRQKNKLSQLIRCYEDSQNKENFQYPIVEKTQKIKKYLVELQAQKLPSSFCHNMSLCHNFIYFKTCDKIPIDSVVSE